MKILLVEDDRRMAMFLARNLIKEGIAVRHESDGREALSAVLNHPFDLVVLDLIIPGIKGEEFLREVRRQHKEIPIIVLSAIQESESRIRLLNLGADDYLCKPFYFAELMARIRSIMKRSTAGETRDDIVVSDLRIIPKMHSVYFRKKRIALRPKEYNVLEYLARRPNQVISRHTLIEQIWGYDARVSSNTVDAHISSLRKKIRAKPKQNPIETVQGLGYVFSSG